MIDNVRGPEFGPGGPSCCSTTRVAVASTHCSSLKAKRTDLNSTSDKSKPGKIKPSSSPARIGIAAWKEKANSDTRSANGTDNCSEEETNAPTASTCRAFRKTAPLSARTEATRLVVSNGMPSNGSVICESSGMLNSNAVSAEMSKGTVTINASRTSDQDTTSPSPISDTLVSLRNVWYAERPVGSGGLITKPLVLLELHPDTSQAQLSENVTFVSSS
eukprot:2671132-Rhodomonas_salina.4